MKKLMMQHAFEGKRPSFGEILPGTYLLKVPFGPVWTGIVLVRGKKNILIDSSHLEPEEYLLPALDELAGGRLLALYRFPDDGETGAAQVIDAGFDQAGAQIHGH